MPLDALLAPSRVRAFGVIAVTSLFGAVMGLRSWNVQQEEFASKAPFLPAIAYVTQVHCEDHGKYHVRVSIPGKPMFEAQRPHFPISCDHFTPNQKVYIWYSAADPSYLTFKIPGQGDTEFPWHFLFVGASFCLGGMAMVLAAIGGIVKAAGK